MHAYCEECLVKLQTESDLICVVCKTTSVPSNSDGLKKLPNHTFFTRLAEEIVIKQKIERGEEVLCTTCIQNIPAVSLCTYCAELQCKDCAKFHANSRNHQGHQHNVMQLEAIRSEKKDIKLQHKRTTETAHCQYDKHGMELNLYCEDCKELNCQYCAMKGEHKNHNYGTVAMIAENHLNKIIDEKLVDKLIDKLTTSEEEVSSTGDKIESQAAEVEQEIDTYFYQVEQTIKKQREALKKELHEVSVQKKKAVLLQLQQLKHIHAQLECMKKLSEAVKSRSDNQEALFMKKQVTEDVQRLEKNFGKLKTNPVELANMKLSKEHEKPFPFFGNLSYGDASLFNTAVIYNPAYGQVGREVKLTIITKDDNHHPCQKGGSKITAQAKPRTGDVITGEVKDDQDGSYTASFVPTQPGEVEISATIDKKEINENCPLSITIRQHSALDKPSKMVNNDGKMGQPWGIAFRKDGVWAIADCSNHCVCIFDTKDQLVKSFGSNGNAWKQSIH